MMLKQFARTIKTSAFALVAAAALPAQATDFYWIGGESSEWANSSNWSLTEGGEAASAYPNGGEDTAFFPSGASLTLNSYAKVRKIFTDGTLTLAGNGNGGIQTVASNNTAPLTIGGTGLIRLAGVNIYVPYATSDAKSQTQITNDLEIVAGTTNVLRIATGNTRYASAYLYGALTGSGTLIASSNTDSTNYKVYLYCDASDFRGVFADHLPGDENATRIYVMDESALGQYAAYDLAATYSGGGMNYVLRAGGTGTTYKMGALNGEVHFDGNNNNKDGQKFGYTLEIGGRNEPCSFGGTMARSNYPSYTKKVGTSDMTFTGSQMPNLTIESGTYIVGASTALPGDMIFTGGAFSVAEGVSVNPPANFSASSTAAVVFDDRGLQNSWSSELTDARVPYGFTKKGAGTLTLTTAPTHTTLTTIEDGTLVVPQGTTIAALSLAGGKLTVPLAGTEDETEVLTISSLADGTTVEALTAAVTVAGVTVSVESGASGYVVKASRTAQTFTWTGAADTAWETGANWTVGGVVASTAPLAVDAVVFPANDDGWSVTISADAVASNIVFNANAEIAAGTCKITTTEISGSGKLTAKGLKLRAPANSNLSIYAPVEIPEGYVFETSVSTQYKHVHLYSKVTGAGTWNMNQDSTNQRGSVQFRGDNGADMSEFAGSLVVINKGSAIRDQTAIYGAIASSSNAVWTLYGFEKDTDSDSSLLKNKDTTYFFGALNGYVCAAGKNATDNINNVWEIGAREDANSVLSGNFFCNGYPNLSASRGDTIRKVGAGSTLTFSGSRVRAYEANAGVLKLASANALLTTWDGGSYAPSIAFNGGTLKLDESVTLDVSTNIAKVASTSAIAFDDEGIDRTWEVELPGTGGLVKKGDGTLTLSEKPLYTGLTTVEAGTLVVPETFTEIVYNPLSAGTLTGVAPTSFAYPAGTTLTGAVASTKNLAGTLSIANVTAVDASAATLEKGQAYVVASATAITGYTRSSLAALPLTLPDGTDPDQWVLKVTTVGGKRALCVAPKIRPTCIFIR